jgi:DNA-binding response OmpR family regulator
MSAPRRIIMLDDDEQLLSLARRALTPPEFEFFGFGDARDALMRLHEIRPELIVCDVAMPAMDGPSFLRVVKRSQVLRNVPFIFLSGLDSEKEILGLLEQGADDFVSKPFPILRLVGKIKATLRLAERFAGAEQRQYTLEGDVGPAGTIPLLKFCEDFRLTGRLSVDSSGRRFWGDFQGGELQRCGVEPEEKEADALDVLLAVTQGSYRIEQQPMDAAALRELESRVGAARAEGGRAAREGPPPLPGGRLSMVEVEGQKLQIQTEGENRPNFAVTTVVVRDGQVIRRIESSWQHSLHEAHELELAKSQIDDQHERVVAGLREGQRPRPAPAPAPEGVELSLLAWAQSFLAEQALTHLGVAPTVTLLKRTRRRLACQKPVLLHFRVADNGRVRPETPSPERLPAGAVTTVAEWAAAFLGEAAAAAPRLRGLPVRSVTRMIERELEKVGFYTAFEKASASVAAPS